MPEISCPLGEAAEKAGKSPAIIGHDQTVSYREADRWVSAVAMRLAETGCRKGERIALLLPNDRIHLILLLALFRLGAVACPLNTGVPPKGIKSLLERIGCSKLILSSDLNLSRALAGLTLLDPYELVGKVPPDHTQPTREEILLDQPATVIFTSGSQGRAKAVLHSYGNHYYNAEGSNMNIRLGPGDRWLLTLPLYHVGGLAILFRCLLGGAAVVLPGQTKEIVELISRYSVSHVSMVPTQLYRILRNQKDTKRLTGLKALLMGGAPMTTALLREASARGIPLHTSYGLTEMASQVTTTATNTPAEKQFTSGKVLNYREVRIAENSDILVRGKTLSLGYVEREQVHLPVNHHGWFATGDLGQIDSEGYLTVLGRSDNMFISGGENIHPEEIETALSELSDIMAALVVPVPDEEFGHRPVAFIQTQKKKIDPEAITAELKPLLPGYKIPIAFYDLPGSMEPERLKVDRATLKKLALEIGHGGSR
ncbi:MAG: o-succinylbenzoate--CoA ligase [Deltaproteobacteria bacterium]|nr:o-succinylbenzoate--CoA ligase [Deltaproteobacteria bacterium]